MLLDLVIKWLLPTYNCCIIMSSCSCHHVTLHLSIIQKSFFFGSYLICIIICICLLTLYLVLDILLNAQVELGAYFLLTPPPFLSPLYNSTIQLSMSLQFFFFWCLIKLMRDRVGPILQVLLFDPYSNFGVCK